MNPSDNYDDTEFLNRMFSKDKEALRIQHVSKVYESTEAGPGQKDGLPKSDSVNHFKQPVT